MSNVLETKIMGVTLKNPVIAASGTFGFGEEYSEYTDVSRLGGISGKGLTLNGSKGNDGIRIYESASGLMNSIGLENPGVEVFVKEKCAVMREMNTAIIANLGGHSLEDYISGVEMLDSADIDILELNISCPNVKKGGMSFGTDPKFAGELVARLRKLTTKPLLVKLTPNAPDIVAVAKACEDNGADGVSLINTLLGMAIDVKRKKAVFNNVYAGFSGPAVMPVALRMVHQVAHSVKIPVVGMGGITTTEDALAFMMAGASAIQVGTATFYDPDAMVKIIQGLEDYATENKLNNISEIVGIV